MQRESELIHFFESRFLNESKLIHSGAIGWIFATFRFCGQSESIIDSLWGIYGFVWASGLFVTVLGVDVFC